MIWYGLYSLWYVMADGDDGIRLQDLLMTKHIGQDQNGSNFLRLEGGGEYIGQNCFSNFLSMQQTNRGQLTVVA